MSGKASYPRLCGGVFFKLLLDAGKQRIKARDTYMGKSDGLSEPETLAALIRVFFPDFPDPYKTTFKSNTTKYKTCRVSDGKYLPFNRESIISEFDTSVRNRYPEAVARMVAFATDFLDLKSNGKYLCKSILALIDLDESIPKDTQFYALPAGNTITKANLKKDKCVYAEALLLGVWHFILTSRKDNTIGVDTASSLELGSAEWTKKAYLDVLPDNAGRKIIFAVPEEFKAEFAEDEEKIEPARPEPVVNYSAYLMRAQDKYGNIKTLLYNDEPHPFYDFYVCNDAIQHTRIAADGEAHPFMRRFENLNIDQIIKCSHYVLLTGTGGLGKSMMMRHLLIDTAKRFDEVKRIPVFIALKDYGFSKGTIFDLVFDALHNLGATVSNEELTADLQAGNFLLLLDGLDEVGISVRAEFERQIDAFIDQYSNNIFVLSSRPFASFIYLNRFTIVHLCPFNKEQALSLIEKLDFRPDEPQIKDKFKKELDERLFDSHNDFATNPLLLTIMLMTYEQYAEVPSKMHVFYQEAYITLSQKHDASKGAYKRPLRTGLTADRFADYFAEFCAKSYLQEKFELTKDEIESYFKQLKVKEKDGLSATAADFIEDLTSNLCLMYYEDGKYQFTHRSFQEYFCAKCFSQWKDKNLKAVGDFFEQNKDRVIEDLTFNMLYDMIPEKVEEYIFLPFLMNLFGKCDDNSDGYWMFLQLMYPKIAYAITEQDDRPHGFPNEPISFIYDFIATESGLNKGENLQYLQLPPKEEFIRDEFIKIDLPDGHRGVFMRGLNEVEEDNIEDVSAPDIPDDADESEPEEKDDDDREEEFLYRFGVPEHFGWLYVVKIEQLLNDKDKYADIIERINAEDFPIKREYYSMRRYQAELSRQQATASDDLFDLF